MGLLTSIRERRDLRARKQAERASHDEYYAAKQAASAGGEVVCATVMADGQPRYFTVPVGATEEQIRDRAFEIRNGRQIMPVERRLTTLADQLRDRLAR